MPTLPINSLAVVSFLFLYQNTFADIPLLKNDVKPALASLSKAKIDVEQMRLVKATHKRIMERQAREKGEFRRYVDKAEMGVEFSMIPIKTKPFLWKGEEHDDVLEVSLDNFWMAEVEVNEELYGEYVIWTQLRNRVRPEEGAMFVAGPSMNHNSQHQMFMYRGVSHHAANSFCRWLSYLTGHFYRLPTEAEWEYACRGGSDKKFSWGDDENKASDYAWFGLERENSFSVSSCYKPAQKKANGFGLFDMHGGRLEWVLDGYVKNRKKHFAKSRVHNPWVRGIEPFPHVGKGGHWMLKLEDIVASARIASSKEWQKGDPQVPKHKWSFTNAPFVGFRMVRPVKIPTAEEMYSYWNGSVR